MENEFQQKLLATFRVETKEHLAALSAGLIELERTPGEGRRQEIVEAVFREAHSMKGAARAVGVAGIETLGHALETVFSAFKRRECAPSPGLFDLLHRAIDTIDRQLSSREPEGGSAGMERALDLARTLARAAQGAPPPAPSSPPRDEPPEPPNPDKAAAVDTVRISAGKLDSLLHHAEELLTARLAARQRAAELGELGGALASWEKGWKKVQSVLRGIRKAQRPGSGVSRPGADAGEMGKLLDFCESSHAALKSVQHGIFRLSRAAVNDRHSLDALADTLLESLKDLLMLPCATVLGALPKMVRELARDQGKEAELAITGESIEIDKRVLEELKEPLIHLVRNCIDHGIEKPERRRLRSKGACGRIAVAFRLVDSGRVEIMVADDGGGIDVARLEEAALRQGIAPSGDRSATGDGELMELIFRSGLSTSPLITDISGRGLGLAIVRERVEKLGGTVTVTSVPQKGTTFRMVIPLTLSTYRGVLVNAGRETFIVPASGVERVARVPGKSLKTVENRETVALDGAALSFVRLADILQLPGGPGDSADDAPLHLFVVGSGANRIAFGVDAVIGDQEVLVKGLGPQLARVRNIAGATVLGTGKVATILHPGDLVKSAVQWSGTAPGRVRQAEGGETGRKSVLVVEDSITSRTLLKNILETAGYHAATAVDGVDALTRLHTEQIDLVVSDVDMPRMNGFDLTAKIRSSGEFAELPVVLVTSLESREDRERGIEAGANAYIVKSSFDQSNLLEAIRRLV